MRLTDIGDLARDLAALAPAMRDTIEPLARRSRAAASGMRGLNNELNDTDKGSKAAKAALKGLAGAIAGVIRASVSWNDEIQKQLRGSMSAATRNLNSYKARTDALTKEAQALASLSGASEESSARIVAGLNAAYQAMGKDMLEAKERMHDVGAGFFTDVYRTAVDARTRLAREAGELEKAAIVSQRMTGMSDASMAAFFKTVMVDLRLTGSDTKQLLDDIAGATRDFGLNGDKAFAVLTDHLEEINHQENKDRLAYARKLITTAGLMERASFDFKKYAGSLLAREGAHGMQDIAMAAAVLGTDQSRIFNLQSRSKNNDLEASKELTNLVGDMLRTQAPQFSLEEYRKNQAGTLQFNSQQQMNRFYESQELAAQWLKLVGMDIASFASMKDAAARTNMLEGAVGNRESAISPHIKNEQAMKEFLYETQTAGEAMEKYKAAFAGVMDTVIEKLANFGNMLGLGTTKSGVQNLFREVSGAAGSWGGIASVGGSAFLLSKLMSGGGIGSLLGGGGGAAALTGAGGAGAGAAAAGGLARFGPIGATLGFALGGIATALKSEQEKDQAIRDSQKRGVFGTVLSGALNPLGQLVLLQRAVSQASDSANALAEADLRFAKAQQLEAEVKRVMQESLTIKQDVKQKGMPRATEQDKAEKDRIEQARSRSDGLLERILSSINQNNSLLQDLAIASQLGPVAT